MPEAAVMIADRNCICGIKPWMQHRRLRLQSSGSGLCTASSPGATARPAA